MRTVYVVCSGPSLKDFDYERLRGEEVITINGNLTYLPNITAYMSIDSKFFVRHEKELSEAAFPLYSIENYQDHPVKERLNVIDLPNKGLNGYKEGGLTHGFNGGYSAVQLAIYLGYDDIRVLGLDATEAGHCNDEPDFDFTYVTKHFAKLKEELPENIQLTFYGDTNIRMFKNKSLKNADK